MGAANSNAIVEAPVENVATPLNPEVEAMVRRYEGDREAVKARSLAATPGLRGKLTDLSSQLARVQDENDLIRQRYLELEDAWQAMGEENNNLKRKNATLESVLHWKSRRHLISRCNPSWKRHMLPSCSSAT